MKQYYKERFKDADWLHIEDIIIGGAGGIGSWTTNFLARIGHTIYLYDYDTVEDINLGGQLYNVSSIGSSKVDATANMCLALSGHTINTVTGKYTETSMVTPIMIAGFDNMAARKVMFNQWKAQEDRELYLDGRLLAEQGQVFAVVKGREADYEKHLFDDSEIEDAPCTMKATTHCSAIIAGMIVALLNNYLGNKYNNTGRELPFKSSFLLPLMLWENEN